MQKSFLVITLGDGSKFEFNSMTQYVNKQNELYYMCYSDNKHALPIEAISIIHIETIIY